ncbi:MAG TPA: hypothetical protein VG713_09330, partial [Pirellulales bacterium]|nr:hypothetical protein [Pirellulales bacterium]
PAVIADLARWQAWGMVDQVAALLDRPDEGDRAVARAAIGYLLLCPSARAREVLSRVRATHPALVAEAERTATLFGGGR